MSYTNQPLSIEKSLKIIFSKCENLITDMLNYKNQKRYLLFHAKLKELLDLIEKMSIILNTKEWKKYFHNLYGMFYQISKTQDEKKILFLQEHLKKMVQNFSD